MDEIYGPAVDSDEENQITGVMLERDIAEFLSASAGDAEVFVPRFVDELNPYVLTDKILRYHDLEEFPEYREKIAIRIAEATKSVRRKINGRVKGISPQILMKYGAEEAVAEAFLHEYGPGEQIPGKISVLSREVPIFIERGFSPVSPPWISPPALRGTVPRAVAPSFPSSRSLVVSSENIEEITKRIVTGAVPAIEEIVDKIIEKNLAREYVDASLKLDSNALPLFLKGSFGLKLLRMHNRVAFYLIENIKPAAGLNEFEREGIEFLISAIANDRNNYKTMGAHDRFAISVFQLLLGKFQSIENKMTLIISVIVEKARGFYKSAVLQTFSLPKPTFGLEGTGNWLGIFLEAIEEENVPFLKGLFEILLKEPLPPVLRKTMMEHACINRKYKVISYFLKDLNFPAEDVGGEVACIRAGRGFKSRSRSREEAAGRRSRSRSRSREKNSLEREREIFLRG